MQPLTAKKPLGMALSRSEDQNTRFVHRNAPGKVDKAGFLILEESANPNEDPNARLVHRNAPATVDEARFSVLQSTGNPLGDQDGRLIHENAEAAVDEAAFLVLRERTGTPRTKTPPSLTAPWDSRGLGSREARQWVGRTENRLTPLATNS